MTSASLRPVGGQRFCRPYDGAAPRTSGPGVYGNEISSFSFGFVIPFSSASQFWAHGRPYQSAP